ncbi:MAG: GMC family oxidoreductase [Vicinamibacterales bacterium]
MADYDVLIVGSGAAGGMAAHILTQKGARVLQLDAGPPNTVRAFETKPVYELPFHGMGDPSKVPHILQASEANENQWVSEKQVPYSHEPKAPYNWVRVRMVGGRTNYWSRMSFRLSDYEFKAKDFDGFDENWPISYADLAPFYDRVDPIFRVAGRKENLKQLPDGQFVEELNPTRQYGPAAQRIIDAAKKRGIADTPTRTSRGLGGVASSANLLLPGALATGKLTLVPNAVVREITVDKATRLANGVNFVDRHSKREMHAKARIVVVGAGTLESTRLLLNSGIANSSGALGHYLHDQFYISNNIWAFVPPVNGAPQAGGQGYMPRCRNLEKGENRNFLRGYALQWSVNTGAPNADYFGLYGDALQKELAKYQGGGGFSCTTMGDVLPRYENKVSINKAVLDEFGSPTLHVNCRYTDNEFNMAKDATALLEELAVESGFQLVARRPEMFPPGYSIHEIGTCRMGDDPKKSVLNKWNQSHDIKNLFVVDGSSFVSGGYQNPTMTISALSMRASEHIAELMNKREL